MSISFPGESPEYRMARNRLLQQEIELRRATEAVAAARRALPPGGIVPRDYIFQQAGPDGTLANVRFLELFEQGKDTLVVYNFMFPYSGDVATRSPTSLAWNAPSCVLTNETRDPWERPGRIIFLPSTSQSKGVFLMNEPVTTIDPRFSDPDTVATPWEETRRVLETTELFWIATVWADGRPHVTPLVAVWLDGAIHFCTGETEQKALNLRRNPHVILTAGRTHWNAGLDVVVEGDAVQVTDDDVLKRLAQAWTTKYHQVGRTMAIRGAQRCLSQRGR